MAEALIGIGVVAVASVLYPAMAVADWRKKRQRARRARAFQRVTMRPPR